MCFYLNSCSSPIIAREDIVVYKVMNINDGVLESIVQINCHNKYNFNKIYTAKKRNRFGSLVDVTKLIVEVDEEEDEPQDLINEGFHSFISYATALAYSNDETEKVIECIIPEGAEYYENDEEYVSTKIKFIKECED